MITKNTTVNTSAGATLRREQAAPGAALPERVEPEVVGVEAGEPAQAEQQHDEHDDRPDDPPAEAEAAPGLERSGRASGRSLGASVGARRSRCRRDDAGTRQPGCAGGCGWPVGKSLALHRGLERVVVAVGALARRCAGTHRSRAPSGAASNTPRVRDRERVAEHALELLAPPLAVPGTEASARWRSRLSAGVRASIDVEGGDESLPQAASPPRVASSVSRPAAPRLGRGRRRRRRPRPGGVGGVDGRLQDVRPAGELVLGRR